MHIRPFRLVALRALAVFALAIAGLGSRAHAQGVAPKLSNAPVDLQLFKPAMDSKGFITLNSSQVLGSGDVSFGLVTTWASKPLALKGTTGLFDITGAPVPSSFRVKNVITPSLQGAVGFVNTPYFGFEMGVVAPLHVLGGSALPMDPGKNAGTTNDDQEFSFTAQGLGDIAVHPKFRFVSASRNRAGIGLGFLPSVYLPTGDKNKFLGEGQVIVEPKVIIDTEWGFLGRFRAAINAGARIRTKSESEFQDTCTATDAIDGHCTAGGYARSVWDGTRYQPTVTNQGVRIGKTEVLGGFGIAYGVVPQRFDLVGEVYGVFGPTSKMIDSGAETALKPAAEAIAGIKLFLARNSFFEAGGGYRVTDGPGGGAPRVFVGFIFEPSIGDRDGDGFKDDVDQCPDDPEDYDDFEDNDGCPEPDNDKDGILDVDDKCPNEPETRNGFQDEDGCPDTANFDRDGDGIVDDLDKCPDDPEDKDGFEDEDGCPDEDNDQDGIKDVDDLCINDPEDKDGWEDQDGCPDPDNDKDRILDGSDRCPNEPETYNGVDDEDGCPDKGKVIVRKGKIEILDKIYFETDKADIKPISFPLLDAIAATLNGNPQIELIEIQGHADERGDDAHNLDLTQRRAASVKRAMEERNVLPGRLTSRGYGETKPECREHNEDCWSRNRRTEFIILRRSDEAAPMQGGEGQ